MKRSETKFKASENYHSTRIDTIWGGILLPCVIAHIGNHIVERRRFEREEWWRRLRWSFNTFPVEV
jgi:hypothetical protein